MSHTLLFDRLRRIARAATARPVHSAGPRRGIDRRTVLSGAAAFAAAGLLPRGAFARPASRADVDVAIIGGGMAGLACGYQLFNGGVQARIYEASGYLGGRCKSLSGFFPGQVAELGGELIDTLHVTMRGYAHEFGLAVEDLGQEPGEVFWWVGDQRYDEAELIEEWRAFVPRMQEDLRTLSGAPNAAYFTEADRLLDYTDLATYLDTRGAGPILRGALESAYVGEYGLELHQQSCLNLLFFIHADRRSKFREFGVYSDERFHIVGGNQQIPNQLGAAMADQIDLGHWLVAMSRSASGRYRMVFDTAGGTVTREADAVVLALPFSTLRNVDLDDSLDLPDWKRYAIDNLIYGTNAKTMVGMTRRTWQDHHGNGSSYCFGLENVQNTWETNPSVGHPRAILTDYASGDRGAGLRPRRLQRQVDAFLTDLDRVYPGVKRDAARDAQGDYQAVLQHWPSISTHMGSYTCNQPGYFTTIADNEGRRVDNLLFAGEHADSFYEWQGFMEGAANSGVAAADALLHDIRSGALGG